jgi:hypothetical protein
MFNPAIKRIKTGGWLDMLYRRDARNRTIDDYVETKPKTNTKGLRRAERVPQAPAGPVAPVMH